MGVHVIFCHQLCPGTQDCSSKVGLPTHMLHEAEGCYSLVVIGLVYKAYPDGCRNEYTFLPRLRPYPVRGHWTLYVRRSSLVGKHKICEAVESTAQVLHESSACLRGSHRWLHTHHVAVLEVVPMSKRQNTSKGFAMTGLCYMCPSSC